MSSTLATDQTDTTRRAAAAALDPNRRLRALRTWHEVTPGPGRQYSAPPTGWGCWPTCACPRNGSDAQPSTTCC